ncbi:zinc-ribbon domain-containing protein [Alkalihalophilus pseudofirmus]|uniref:zinc ribbon domain-containing protein n=1 Tax=Alkalihalophilus pseudofirmus TaxID=79885 RepID=UPI00259BD378|nr:zinc-ribbon domain-containing protein [Alkalihalophilus pseudofirmus]WEG16735.1 zinc-ribbon domain-containing protein [Alkalihalophilus pseudofirmus]
MKFCKECGSPLKAGAVFCAECGTPTQNNVKNPNQQIAATTSSVAEKSPPQKSFSFNDLTKKQKLFGLSAVLAFILLISFHQIMSSITSKERVIESFKTAILEQDSDKLLTLLHSSDPRLEIHEEGTASIIHYVLDNPSYYESLMSDLNQQAAMLDINNDLVPAEEEYYDYDYNSDFPSVFHLQKEGKTALFYDQYRINVTPFYLYVSTNYEDSVIKVNGEPVTTATSYDFTQELGPFMPGYYELKSEYSNEYSLLEETQFVELFYQHNNYSNVQLNLYGDYVTIYADYEDHVEDSKIFINNEETPYTLQTSADIGPLSLDETISVYAELSFPWGTVKTGEKLIDSSHVDLNVENIVNETDKEHIINLGHQFGEQLMNAYETDDVHSITIVTSDYHDRIANDFDSETYESFVYKEGYFNPQNMRLDTSNEELEISMPIRYTFETQYYESESTDERQEEYWVTFHYDQENQAWLIDSHDQFGYFDYFEETSETVQKTYNAEELEL